MTHFVVVYDRSTGEAQVRTFDGENAPSDALEERLRAEQSAGPNQEVAILTSDSMDDLRATHARYFRNTVQMVDDLEKRLAS